MIGTLLMAAAYLLPALVARKRKMGFTRALLLSLIATPLFALPLALKSKPRLPKSPSSASSGGKANTMDPPKPSVQHDPSITDAWITGEKKGMERSRRQPSVRQVKETPEKRSESKGVRI